MQTCSKRRILQFLGLALLLCAAACNDTQSRAPLGTERQTSTGLKQGNVSSPAPTRLFWGDLHVHSRTSFDSYAFGNTNLTAADAFRFARGEPVRAHNGELAQLARPLDFLLVSDHAEFMGMMEGLQLKNPTLLASPLGKRWLQHVNNNDMAAITREFLGFVNSGEGAGAPLPLEFQQQVWHGAIATADVYNEPGVFTAFIGYEWTAMIDGRNLHRNVLFRDGADRTRAVQPFSAVDSNRPEALWQALAAYEQATGGRVMAIPHNSNLSSGMMFDERDSAGAPLDIGYVQQRLRFERVVEMTQMKGDSETHPLVSPDDELADFESWDKTDIGFNPISDEEKMFAYSHSYVRPVLGRGLRYAAELGANPFQFGLLGSTDSHTTLATADDDNFFGKFNGSEPRPERLTNKMADVMWLNRTLAASGYAAVWASDNTRAALFDALERRETYATTGPRIAVRFFGGWQFAEQDAAASDVAARGYAKGVPMGGVLPERAAATARAPGFIVSAMKDPVGANLDRVQIIKLWQHQGRVRERIYNIAWSDARELNALGQLAALPSSVDTSTAQYSNTHGAATLSAFWRDPDFDAKQHALYYARVIEIATPRWTTYDAVRFQQPLPSDVPAEIQERAYTSPIWYRP